MYTNRFCKEKLVNNSSRGKIDTGIERSLSTIKNNGQNKKNH
uniref:Uncharacterized protein n=1 Tax=viral metagenome TaxID=1070528 RepID=A0A6C0HJ27_9ZZZZ